MLLLIIGLGMGTFLLYLKHQVTARTAAEERDFTITERLSRLKR